MKNFAAAIETMTAPSSMMLSHGARSGQRRSPEIAGDGRAFRRIVRRPPSRTCRAKLPEKAIERGPAPVLVALRDAGDTRGYRPCLFVTLRACRMSLLMAERRSE